MMPFIGNWQLVELIINTTGLNQQVYFQNQPQLQSISGDQSIYLEGLTTYTEDTLISSPLTTGNPMATARDILNAVLVLSVGGRFRYNMIPLSDLCRTQTTSLTPSNQDMYILKQPWRVDWTKSYVQVITAPLVVPFSYIFGVVYDYKDGSNYQNDV